MCEYSDFSKTSPGDWMKFVQKKTFNASPWHCRTWPGWFRRTGGWSSFPRRLSRTVPLIFTQMITFTNITHSSETDLLKGTLSRLLPRCCQFLFSRCHQYYYWHSKLKKNRSTYWGGVFCIPHLPCLRWHQTENILLILNSDSTYDCSWCISMDDFPISRLTLTNYLFLVD